MKRILAVALALSALAALAYADIIDTNRLNARFFGTVFVQRIQNLGAAAPTAGSTGFGASPTNSVDTGSSDTAGTVTVTAGGAGPAATGTVTLTFSTAFGTNAPACDWTLGNGTGSWNGRATVINGTQSTASSVVNWDNNAVAVTAASTYKLSYVCFAK